MSYVFVRNAFNYDRGLASRESGLSCPEPTRTEQSFREECDINTIVARFGVTGELPLTTKVPMQGDFTTVVDYQTSLDMIRQADQAFAELPAAIRKRFGNDPSEYVEFVSDPANLDEVRKMGLARPESAPPAPVEVRVIPEPTPEPAKAPTP